MPLVPQLFPSQLQPYSQISSTQQAQVLAATQRSLQRQFPWLSSQQWARLLAEYEPWVLLEGEPATAQVEGQSLVCFANWLHLLHPTQLEEEVPLYSHESQYLARNLTFYSDYARELHARDPELTQPESIAQMRAIIKRLLAGNTVAEEICRVFQKPVRRDTVRSNATPM